MLRDWLDNEYWVYQAKPTFRAEISGRANRIMRRTLFG